MFLWSRHWGFWAQALLFLWPWHTLLKPYNLFVLHILFTAGASKLHDTMARRDPEDGTRHIMLYLSATCRYTIPF